MISEKERRWVERMQRAGLFPSPPPPPKTQPPNGQWSMESQPNGEIFVQINNVPMPTATALEIIQLLDKKEPTP
jgi:hypothetical protein